MKPAADLLGFLIRTVSFIALAVLIFWRVSVVITADMPIYRQSVGYDNHTEKMTGLYLMKESAALDDDLIIYGSSELRTFEINTHPSNFFFGKRAGFQPNIIGRGSCQSLTHAMSIAASGNALTSKKIVLITSPQSFVEPGIAPDLFMANFSPQQYLELMAAQDIPDETKRAISYRVSELMGQYETMTGKAETDPALRYLAGHNAQPTIASSVRNAILSPYYAFSRYLNDLRDKASARAVIDNAPPPEGRDKIPASRAIDWEAEEAEAIAKAREMTRNNDFGILDDYFTTYIGTRLPRYEGMDTDLSYSFSKEYGDLRILLEVCRIKGIEPLLVHVPLHGEWSDYTGFESDRRYEYYQNVRDIAGEYGVEVLDLTVYEYEEHFLCDIMHLGWKGWLEFDKAVIEYYHRT